VETVKTRPTQSTYVVYKYDDIIDKIIPFFEKYPILGSKALDFSDFKLVADLIKEKAHLKKSGNGLAKILAIKSQMNR
jgi:hypothetical protein